MGRMASDPTVNALCVCHMANQAIIYQCIVGVRGTTSSMYFSPCQQVTMKTITIIATTTTTEDLSSTQRD